MRRLGLFAVVILGLVACGGSDEAPPTGSSSETCNSQHQCVNDVCECTTSGLSGTSCTEATCEAECEVCTST